MTGCYLCVRAFIKKNLFVILQIIFSNVVNFIKIKLFFCLNKFYLTFLILERNFVFDMNNFVYSFKKILKEFLKIFKKFIDFFIIIYISEIYNHQKNLKSFLN